VLRRISRSEILLCAGRRGALFAGDPFSSGNKLDLCAMAMGLGEPPVAGEERRTEALGKGDVHSIGHRVSAAQFVGALDEWLCGPTSHRQVARVCYSDESFVIADQLAHNGPTYCPDHFDVEMGRYVHCLVSQAPRHRGPRRRCEDEL
jgi:hypothetical protein